MKITKVTATVHDVSVQVPLLDRKFLRPVVLARVETDEGITGIGMSGGILRFSTREFINRELDPFLQGKDPLATERLWHEMYWTFNQRGMSGVVQYGISAVDIALWDIKGKYLNQPVYRLLGGNARTVPAYITFGLLEYRREELVEVARQFVQEGHDKLKMVVAYERDGRKDINEDVARVRAVREAVGPDVELMVDANHLFNFLEAKELALQIEPYRITWFEEPLYANDARLLAQLRQVTRIPIAAGQNEGHRWRHRELIASGAVDIVQPNVVYVGGYTEALKVAHIAQAYNLPVANGGGWPHHNMHLIAGVSNGWRVEFHLLMWYVGETIFKNPPRPEKGWVTLPEGPGLGLEPNEDALKETEVR